MASKSHTTLPVPATALAFRPEYLDFRRGIRVGNLEDNERITRILKLALESRYAQPFVTERWGRGVYWQWIGYLPRANREAMPLSSRVSFGCSKFFLSVDTEEKLFKCGMQVERGYMKAPRDYRECQLQSDWDWHRLLRSLQPRSPMERELKRLVLPRRLHASRRQLGNRAGLLLPRQFPVHAEAPTPSGRCSRRPLGWIPALLPHERRRGPRLDRTRPRRVDARRLPRSHPRHEPLHAGPTGRAVINFLLTFDLARRTECFKYPWQALTCSCRTYTQGL